MHCVPKKITQGIHTIKSAFALLFATRVYCGKNPANCPEGAIILFPLQTNRLNCGLAGIVAFKPKKSKNDFVDFASVRQRVDKVATRTFEYCQKNDLAHEDHYLGGEQTIDSLLDDTRRLKRNDQFKALFEDKNLRAEVDILKNTIDELVANESRTMARNMGRMASAEVDRLTGRLETLKDIAWCLGTEIAENIDKVQALLNGQSRPNAVTLGIYRNINAVLNSIDRLEVRGRDSAGLSLLFILSTAQFKKFEKELNQAGLANKLSERACEDVLVNGSIGIKETADRTTVTFTYKIAAEIGRLGDNIRFLRSQLTEDPIFHRLSTYPHIFHTVSSHTRWASVGAITEANCHPVDNEMVGGRTPECGIIHVCLNGDIDNYLNLKADHERAGKQFDKRITTDTKIIPLQIEKYIQSGHPVEEAFRLAVNDFEGSHAISMHTDLAPGKLFLAQHGSGQSIFIGLAEDHYMPTSEVYGFVEETQNYIKINGEKIIEGKNGPTQGQIYILDQSSMGGLDGIRAVYYDGTPVEMGAEDLKHTQITSRDIDRQSFPHYFLKEISESPLSVERTIQNRWKLDPDNENHYRVTLDSAIMPESLKRAIIGDATPSCIRRIYFVGQGTAGVAAQACADILNAYLNDSAMNVSALKASELSGFKLGDSDAADSMDDALVIAISQSGTTTDTNRTVDMVKERGAHTMAIVNRRDSDITFKVDGVMYTSSGRDIEMSVASTKAFYSQIIAGALLSLNIAVLRGRRDADFVTAEIKRLLEVPDHMRKVLAMRESIKASAEQLAIGKTYWAAVGSGPNKASADEIRIKLSELCYKTISTDFVEDKKHIDLSSEPLIIVCAAGTRNTVIGDIIKDTAIFRAHKATPVVIADEGENRFAPYAADVFHVPAVSEHLAPILNTLVGHIWGYYAALAINEGSRFLYQFQKSLRKTLNAHTDAGMNLYEVILEKSFKEKIAQFYNSFRRKKADRRMPTIMGLETASDLTLLLKYLAGKLPVADFELDFGVKGTPVNMLNNLFACLGAAINNMARPVDAIKHQAKTVTVGTSRIGEKMEGIIFERLAAHSFNLSQMTNQNILVLRNIQEIIHSIEGAIRYRIGNLTLLGEPTGASTILVEKKEGVLNNLPSRVETDSTLKGTKKIIVREGNVYIGKGRKDDRSIVVIPLISTSADTPNLIDHLLLLNVAFKKDVPLPIKIKALGDKLEHIINIVQENSVIWKDENLEIVPTEELFGRSAEKIGEHIVSAVA